jgi:hypothetical protein
MQKFLKLARQKEQRQIYEAEKERLRQIEEEQKRFEKELYEKRFITV